MATGDYCTLAQLKQHVIRSNTYSAATISFTGTTKTITDTAKGLARFATGNRIQVSGSVANNSFFTIATGGVTGSIVVNETVTDGIAGPTVVISDVTDVVDDTFLASLITAASRAIDKETSRSFYASGSHSSPETRYFDANDQSIVLIDDCTEVTALVTDDDGSRQYATTWTTSDYDLYPYNAASSIEPEPYVAIQRTPNSGFYFPRMGNPSFSLALRQPSSIVQDGLGHKAVKVTGVWGWSAVPAQITQACLLQAHRWFKRRDSIFGVMGLAESGQMTMKFPVDPDLANMLKNYKKLSLA